LFNMPGGLLIRAGRFLGDRHPLAADGAIGEDLIRMRIFETASQVPQLPHQIMLRGAAGRGIQRVYVKLWETSGSGQRLSHLLVLDGLPVCYGTSPQTMVIVSGYYLA
jgi:hypothetical protein